MRSPYKYIIMTLLTATVIFALVSGQSGFENSTIPIGNRIVEQDEVQSILLYEHFKGNLLKY